MSLLFDDDQLTPEERKRINDIRSGEIIDATPANLQSLLDYMIGKQVRRTSSWYPENRGDPVYLDFKRMIVSGFVVSNGVNLVSAYLQKPKTRNSTWIEHVPPMPIIYIIRFPGGDLNRLPTTIFGFEQDENTNRFLVVGYIRSRILRHINMWKKIEGF